MSKSFEAALSNRKADNQINPLFLKRWSSRSMTGEEISSESLNSLLEAARWAPSTMNEQEWRFLYASQKSVSWESYFAALVEANQVWCKNASHLIVVLSRTQFARNGNPNPVHEFDAGAAFQNLVLEAADRNLVAHGLAGFDNQKIRDSLKIPENFAIHAMVAVGVYDPTEKNLSDALRGRETPSVRKPLSEISAEGEFKFAS